MAKKKGKKKFRKLSEQELAKAARMFVEQDLTDVELRIAGIVAMPSDPPLIDQRLVDMAIRCDKAAEARTAYFAGPPRFDPGFTVTRPGDMFAEDTFAYPDWNDDGYAARLATDAIGDEKMQTEDPLEYGMKVMTGDAEIDQMLRDVMETLEKKGAEYTEGSSDRLANFKNVATALRRPGLPIEMQDVWMVYFFKHWSSIVSYLKNDCQVKSDEPISGRIMDCIVFLLLFHKMTLELDRVRATKKAT